MFRWGWCGEGCPLRGSTWGTDRTLTVTTHTVFVFDLDIYIVPGILILLALFLFSFTKKFNRHGTLGTFIFLKKKIGDNVFLLVEKIKRGIIKGLKFWQKRADRKEKEKKLVIGILATVLTVFIFLNITCLVLVLTGYI